MSLIYHALARALGTIDYRI